METRARSLTRTHLPPHHPHRRRGGALHLTHHTEGDKHLDSEGLDITGTLKGHGAAQVHERTHMHQTAKVLTERRRYSARRSFSVDVNEFDAEVLRCCQWPCRYRGRKSRQAKRPFSNVASGGVQRVVGTEPSQNFLSKVFAVATSHVVGGATSQLQ